MKNLLLISVLALCSVATGEVPKTPLDNIQITADSMQYDPSNKQALAKNNVKLMYMVKNLPVTLVADNMMAYFDDSGKLIKAVAEGNVAITYNGAKLYAQTCTHDFNKEQTVCTGQDVTIIKGGDEVHGTKATLDINTQVFTMHATEQNQVKGIIYPVSCSLKESHHKNP